MTRQFLAVLILAAGCAPAHPVPAVAACPAAPGADRILASVFVDGRRVADGVPVALTATEPEAYDFIGEPPQAVRDLPPGRINLVQFVGGDAARVEHGACPGMVAVLITTTPRR